MSYSDTDIEDAVEAGAISRNEADRLLAFLAGENAASGKRRARKSEEQFRLLTGFNDIFISVVLMLVLGSFLYIFQTVSEDLLLSVPAHITSGFGESRLFESNQLSTLATAILAWLLAEYFTRKRRMALPSILLMLVFILCVFITFFVSYVSLMIGDAGTRGSDPDIGWPVIVGACGWIAGTILHWLRFRVPIGFAVGMAGLVPLSFGGLQLCGITPNEVTAQMVMIALGLISLAAALWWDSRNTLRITRDSDVAFWLHLLAATLIVHPVFAQLGHTQTVADGALVLSIYLVLCLISIVLDRRAFMIIALGYSVYAANVIFAVSGFDQFPFAVSAFSIGGSLLLLSVMWHPARRTAMKALPERLKAYFPPA